MKLFNRKQKTSRICGRIYNELNSIKKFKIGIVRENTTTNATRSETKKSKKKQAK